MYSTCLIKNMTSESITLVGVVIEPDTPYQIPDNLRINWYGSDEVLYAITHEQVQVGNGSSYFSEYSDQIDWLRVNKIDAEITNLGEPDMLGRHSLAVIKPAGDSFALSSHNFCDPCTWYGQSVRVEDEELVFNSGGNYYESDHAYWIDMTHGRHYGEDWLGGAYDPIIEVGGEVVTEGFTIDYENGRVSFDSTPSGTVTATYSYANGSTYTLAPPPGHRYILEHTEIQFSVGTEISSQVLFELWVYNPDELPNKMLYFGYKYKSAKDFINTSNLGQGVITAFGELTKDIIVLPYNYANSQPICGAQGCEIRIRLHDDIPLSGGELGAVTFYVEDQPE